MPCLLLLIVLAFPRVVLALMFLLSNYLERAYHGLLIPLLGFIFLPLTTIVYAWMANSHRSLNDPVNLVLLIIAVVFDLGGIGGGEWHRRRRYYD
ncbi:MAG TPA: hypothetical protein VKU19_14330 [Bryobacteraceae bacterium]|nr:hypothetical protein [Bryobacteraceae bacterium]